MNDLVTWPPLPLRDRVKLKTVRMIDGVGIWLCNRGHDRMAEALWRFFGLWT